MECYLCGRPGALSFWCIGILDDKIPFHPECALHIKCRFCEEEIKSGSTIKQLGASSYMGHVIESNITHLCCSSSICPICDKIVGTATQTSSKDGKVYHNDCVWNLQCLNCKAVMGGHGFISVGKEIRHNSSCSSGVCPLCKEIIGSQFRSFTDDGGEYHSICLANTECYVCKQSYQGYHGHKIADGSEKSIRHVTCSIERCHECQEYMGIDTWRRVEDKIYHRNADANRGLCGPVCECCRMVDYTKDLQTLKLYSNGKYRHTTCSGPPCMVCSLPLGLPDTVQGIFTKDDEELMLIHKECSFTCQKCGMLGPLMTSLALDPILTIKNKKLMPLLIKQSYITLWVILSRQQTTIIDYGQTRKIPLPRDVKSLILETFIQNENFRHMAPIRKGLFDLRSICTFGRCTDEDRCVCDDSYSWNSDPISGCHLNRCTAVVKDLRSVGETVLGLENIGYYWPETEQAGIDAIKSALSKSSSRILDPQKLAVYTTIIDAISALSSLHGPIPEDDD